MLVRAGTRAGPLLVLLLALAAPFGAQADQASRDRARALYRTAKVAYAAGDFLKAAQLFSEGYELDRQPAFLLNIAQSYRSAEVADQALFYYRKYLEADPGSTLRPQVEELIKELEIKIAASRPPPPVDTALIPPPEAAPPVESEPSPSVRSRPIYKRWWFWTAVGVVVVGAGAGLVAWGATREPDYVKEGGLGSVRW